MGKDPDDFTGLDPATAGLDPLQMLACKLDPLELLFCENLIRTLVDPTLARSSERGIGGNATWAYCEAYDYTPPTEHSSAARVAAHKLRHDPRLKAYLDARRKEVFEDDWDGLIPSTNEILARFGRIVRFRSARAFNASGKIDVNSLIEAGDDDMIAGVKIKEFDGENSSGTETELKFHDPLRAGELILRQRGEFTTKHEIDLSEGTVKIIRGVSMDDL